MRTQLADSVQQAEVSIHELEEELLLIQRGLVHTTGMARAIADKDAESARELALPQVVNAGADLGVVLDRDGLSVVALRRIPGAAVGSYESVRNEDYYAAWPSVGKALSGGPTGTYQSGLHYLEAGGESTYALVVVSAVEGTDDRSVGAVVVGRYMPELGQDIAGSIGGVFTVYSPLSGQPLSSSLDGGTARTPPLSEDLITRSMGTGPLRSLSIDGRPYRELLAPMAVGGDSTVVAVMGVAHPDLVALGGDIFLPFAREDIILGAALYLALVILLSFLMTFFLSNSIIRPVERLREAVDSRNPLPSEAAGSWEILELVDSINGLLQEDRDTAEEDASRIYTKLLESESADRSDSTPLARPELEVDKRTSAAILVAELDGLDVGTGDDNRALLAMEGLFDQLIAIITKHQGRLINLRGAMITAAFGLRPRELPAQVSTLSAAHAAMEIVEHLEDGSFAGSQPKVAIGLAWGQVVSARLGGAGRYHDVLVGEALDLADRLHVIAQSLGPPSILLSEESFQKLGSAANQFKVHRRGEANLRRDNGRTVVCEIVSRTTSLVGPRANGGERFRW